MPYTFGAATTNRISFTPAVTFSSPASSGVTRAGLVWGWWYPTTLTGDRYLWGMTSGSGLKIDATDTTKVRYLLNNATTAPQHTFPAALTTNKWHFIAILIVPADGATVVPRLWKGTIDSAPVELTATQTAAAVGNYVAEATMAACNYLGSAAFRGDGGELGYVFAEVDTMQAPFFLASPTAIAQAEADLTLDRIVRPAWLGSLNPAFLKTASGLMEAATLRMNTLPVLHVLQTANTNGDSTRGVTVTGAVVSQNGHPRGRSNLSLHPTRRR